MMRALREPMTIRELKRYMDRRFDRLERTKADKADLVRLRSELRSELGSVRSELRSGLADVRRALRGEIQQSAEETRRHFDVVAESLRDDLRLFAEAIGSHSERLDRHDVRIHRLEQRP